MSNLLGHLGLEAEDPSAQPEPEAPVAPEPAPEAPAEPTPEPEAPSESEIVVPEGAENPDAVKRAIQAERANARAHYKRARELESELAARDEASKPLEERVTSATERADEAELRALRIEVGVEHGLSLTLARRLSGTDRSALETDAKALVAELGTKPKPQLPGLDGGPKPPPATPADPAQAHNAFLAQVLGRQR